jgi:hypothetical protein
MNQNKTAQSIATFAILIALLIFIALLISRKLIKPKLEEMYKTATEMIE